MYPDESGRVVVYYLTSHNMLGWIECMILWNYIWLNGWNLLCFSLPYFCCCVICCVVLSLAMIINSLVWADARTPADNRVVIGLLHNLCWLDFISWWVFFRAWAHVLFMLSKLLHLLIFQLYPVGIVVCLVLWGWR